MSYNTSLDQLRSNPLRVAVEVSGAAGAVYWADLTVGVDGTGPLDPTAESTSVVRVRAADLREARTLRDRARADAAAQGRNPDSVTVLVDIDVVVDADARSARRRAQAAWRNGAGGPGSVSYVGTPQGLAGLIADIHAVRVADGVTLVPVGGGDSVDLIVDETVPQLEQRGVVEISTSIDLLRRRLGVREAALAS